MFLLPKIITPLTRTATSRLFKPKLSLKPACTASSTAARQKLICWYKWRKGSQMADQKSTEKTFPLEWNLSKFRDCTSPSTHLTSIPLCLCLFYTSKASINLGLTKNNTQINQIKAGPIHIFFRRGYLLLRGNKILACCYSATQSWRC